jgi:hypothetical protein
MVSVRRSGVLSFGYWKPVSFQRSLGNDDDATWQLTSGIRWRR